MISIKFIPDYLFKLTVISLFTLFACQSTDTTAEKTETPSVNNDATEFVVQAESFLEASEGMTVSEDKNSVQAGADVKGWLSYEIDVPQAGRYEVEVQTNGVESGEAVFWVEDYIDNTDGRTYNVTGAITISGEGAQANSVDGSPLDAGKHQIRLHKDGAGANIDAISFKMIRAHEVTPELLTQNMEGEEWKIAWSDEFDGEGLVDAEKWTYDVGDWGWGNNELQYYTVENLKNARQENGNLIIEAHKDDDGNAWTSARLTTRGKVAFKYGKIEFRAKVPAQKGNWAAGWTLGDTYKDEKSWPYCGEIDIMESVGYELDNESGDGKAHASVHCGAYYFKLGNQHTADVPVSNMVEEFHTYGVIWTPEKITAYVDDNPYFEYSDTKDSLTWPFDIPQNIILNLAMGGGWGGAQGMDETVTSQELVIDYVRVYEKQ